MKPRIVYAVVAASILAVAAVEEVPAHDALPTASQPQGWSYPFACCSSNDCRAVGADAIHEGPMHYTIVGTGEEIAYNDKRVRPSPDGEFHWCSVAGRDDSRTICLFVPPRAY